MNRKPLFDIDPTDDPNKFQVVVYNEAGDASGPCFEPAMDLDGQPVILTAVDFDDARDQLNKKLGIIYTQSQYQNIFDVSPTDDPSQFDVVVYNETGGVVPEWEPALNMAGHPVILTAVDLLDARDQLNKLLLLPLS